MTQCATTLIFDSYEMGSRNRTIHDTFTELWP